MRIELNLTQDGRERLIRYALDNLLSKAVQAREYAKDIANNKACLRHIIIGIDEEARVLLHLTEGGK